MSADGDAARAARQLRINQPSMSKRLAVLQHAGRGLPAPWVERHGKTWRLTPAGAAAFPAAEDVVRRYHLLVAGPPAAGTPAFVVACGRDAAAGLVLDAVRRFRVAHPCPVSPLRVVSPRGEARIEGVANGRFDLATVTHSADDVRALARRPVYLEDLSDDPLVLAAHPSAPSFDEFRAASGRRAFVRLLGQVPLVLPDPDAGLRREFDRRCREAGILVGRVVVEVGGWAVIRAYVREGVGVGLLPRSVAAAEPELFVHPLPAAIAPPNVVRVVARRKGTSDEPDVSEPAAAFLAVFRESAAAAASGPV